MTTEHTLQQLKEIAEAGGELLGFIVVNGEGHGGYAWGYSRRAAEDELMAVKAAENPAHGPFAIVAAHTPTISKVDALDLIAQVEKLEAEHSDLHTLFDLTLTHLKSRKHRKDDAWVKALIHDGEALLRRLDPSVPDPPAKDGTARDGTGQ